MQPNPYTPGSTPRYLAGRGEELARVRRFLTPVVAFGEMAGPQMVLHGPRGVGKTSLLRAVAGDARAQGFATTWTSCVRGQPFLADLASGIERSLTGVGIDTTSSRWRARLTKVGLELGLTGPKVSAEFEPTPRTAHGAVPPAGSVAPLETLLGEAARAVRDRGGAGLVVALDELHAPRELDVAVLLNAIQNLDGERDQHPLAVIGAGLPSVRGGLTRAATFGERTHWLEVGTLDPADAADLLVHPAAGLKVTWQPDALRALLEQADGYPYFLQVLGSAAWEAAAPEAGAEIDVGHAEAGILAGAEQLRSMYAARWQAATGAEKTFLTAMAELGGDAPVARIEIARRLSRSSRALSATRERLLDKAIIVASDHGEVRFTLPGFAGYVLDQDSDS